MKQCKYIASQLHLELAQSDLYTHSSFILTPAWSEPCKNLILEQSLIFETNSGLFLQDPSSTLYMKVGENQTTGESGQRGGSNEGSSSSSSHHYEIIIPLLFCFFALILLLVLLLGFNIKRRKKLQERLISSSLSLPGAPVYFSFHELQMATNNFSRLLGTGNDYFLHLSLSLVNTVFQMWFGLKLNNLIGIIWFAEFGSLVLTLIEGLF